MPNNCAANHVLDHLGDVLITGGGALFNRSDGAVAFESVELIENGGFDSADPWVIDAGWAIGSGVATCSGAGDIYQTLGSALESGATYTVRGDFTKDGLGAIRVYVGTTPTLVLNAASTGSWSNSFVAAGGETKLSISRVVSATGTADNISLIRTA